MTIFDIHNNESYRKALVDSLCSGISDPQHLKLIIDYFLDEKLHLFNNDFYKGSLYEGDDNISDLILPSIRRVWGKIFVTPPEVLRVTQHANQLEMLQLSFDIDEFVNYLLDILPKSKNCLDHFDKLDRTVETLSIIVDNYVAGKIKFVIECKDQKAEIQRLKRENKINNLFND